jgi:hypothetical protein
MGGRFGSDLAAIWQRFGLVGERVRYGTNTGMVRDALLVENSFRTIFRFNMNIILYHQFVKK